jgi:hypothetical protein
MFSEQHKLPRSMHRRMTAYFEFLHSGTTHTMDRRMLDDLSPAMRMDVYMYLYSDLVTKVPFLRNKSAYFIAELLPTLQLEVFPPDEQVVIEVRFNSSLKHDHGATSCQLPAALTVWSTLAHQAT